MQNRMDVYSVVGVNVLYQFRNRRILVEMSSLSSIPARDVKPVTTLDICRCSAFEV
jgi:hypothetical protein